MSTFKRMLFFARMKFVNIFLRVRCMLCVRLKTCCMCRSSVGLVICKSRGKKTVHMFMLKARPFLLNDLACSKTDWINNKWLRNWLRTRQSKPYVHAWRLNAAAYHNLWSQFCPEHSRILKAIYETRCTWYVGFLCFRDHRHLHTLCVCQCLFPRVNRIKMIGVAITYIASCWTN